MTIDSIKLGLKAGLEFKSVNETGTSNQDSLASFKEVFISSPNNNYFQTNFFPFERVKPAVYLCDESYNFM